jgi:tetratricopeptide (TPR) repeat protein
MKVTEAEQLKRAFASSLAEKAEQIPEILSLKQTKSLAFLVPHLEEVAKYGVADLSDDDLIWPFVGLSRTYEAQGLYSLAEPWRQQCLDVASDRFGELNINVAVSLGNLASLYFLLGRYSEAEPLISQVVQYWKHSVGAD